MSLLMTVLLLLVCLLISNVISHYIPFIPTALIQIALGILIASSFKDISFELETEWFLLLFVAPLLYNDGRHFPREELWKMRAPIFGNAIVLVLLTTIGGGIFIHWIIPSIPLAAAFALAAILSPTDPVAVNGITKRIHLPEKVLTLVRGESLINDASGLVAFNYAIAAVITGYFSLKEAIFDFSYIFIAGAFFGLVIGLIITWIKHSLRKKGISDASFHSLLQILTPFIIYIITEEGLHASGVIAVVVAGIVHSIVEERTEILAAEERLLTENIWSMILFVLNGIVFLLLGLNIPSSVIETVSNPRIGNGLAIEYVVAIGLAILVIRFVWTYIFFHYQYYFGKIKGSEKLDFRTCLLISLTGVRGTVTMAGVLSIPYVVQSGALFPERSLMLFLAAGVILFTLVVATIFLPLLSTAGEFVPKSDLTEAKRKIIVEAIKQIRQEVDEENELVAYELIAEYRRLLGKIETEKNVAETKEYQRKITEIRLMGLKEERKYIQNIREKGQIDQETFEVVENSLDHREEVLSNNVRTDAKYILGKAFRGWLRYKGHYPLNDETNKAQLQLGRDVQLKAFEAAHEKLERYAKEHPETDMIHIVVLDYKRMLNRLVNTRAQYNEKREELREGLCIKVMDTERFEISRMYKSGEINNEQSKGLRRFVNYIENVILYEAAEE